MKGPTTATAYRVAALYAGLLALGSVALAPLRFFPPRLGPLRFSVFWLVVGSSCFALVLFLALARRSDRAARENKRWIGADDDRE